MANLIPNPISTKTELGGEKERERGQQTETCTLSDRKVGALVPSTQTDRHCTEDLGRCGLIKLIYCNAMHIAQKIDN